MQDPPLRCGPCAGAPARKVCNIAPTACTAGCTWLPQMLGRQRGTRSSIAARRLAQAPQRLQTLTVAEVSAGVSGVGASALRTPFGVWVYTPHTASCGCAPFARMACPCGHLWRHEAPGGCGASECHSHTPRNPDVSLLSAPHVCGLHTVNADCTRGCVRIAHEQGAIKSGVKPPTDALDTVPPSTLPTPGVPSELPLGGRQRTSSRSPARGCSTGSGAATGNPKTAVRQKVGGADGGSICGTSMTLLRGFVFEKGRDVPFGFRHLSQATAWQRVSPRSRTRNSDWFACWAWLVNPDFRWTPNDVRARHTITGRNRRSRKRFGS